MMKILLVSGLSWSYKGVQYVQGTLFDPAAIPSLTKNYFNINGRSLDLSKLVYSKDGQFHPLLRSREDTTPNLTSAVLQSILLENGCEFASLSLQEIKDGNWGTGWEDCDAICLSTTFICNELILSFVLKELQNKLPHATLVMGGQYSNLKYKKILTNYSYVRYILTGDGEESIPALFRAIEKGGDVSRIPNLAMRDPLTGGVKHTGIQYVDLDAYPCPRFVGQWKAIPYESMRGCPFSCRYCSYPAASPQWRYKSARKIFQDWTYYRDVNGASHIKAMDSTFTVPRDRLQELLTLLPGQGITWEAYSRANLVRDRETIEALERAGCVELSVGFESMSDKVLGYMNKKVRSKDNRKIAELLEDSGIKMRVCMMVGYPGETPEEYSQTHDYLVDEFTHRFMLSPFSFIDETMPVWEDIDRFQVEVDPHNLHGDWKHCGMDNEMARALIANTLDKVRLQNETGLMLLWQWDYDMPFIPHLPDSANKRIEKLIERIAFLPKDYPNKADGEGKLSQIIEELGTYGVYFSEASQNQLSPVDSVWIDFIV